MSHVLFIKNYSNITMLSDSDFNTQTVAKSSYIPEGHLVLQEHSHPSSPANVLSVFLLSSPLLWSVISSRPTLPQILTSLAQPSLISFFFVVYFFYQLVMFSFIMSFNGQSSVCAGPWWTQWLLKYLKSLISSELCI